MKLNSLDEKIKRLAKGATGKLLRETLEEICRMVADIRTPMSNVKPEVQNEVRLGVIDCIDSILLTKLKIYSGENDPEDIHEFE